MLSRSRERTLLQEFEFYRAGKFITCWNKSFTTVYAWSCGLDLGVSVGTAVRLPAGD
ncbi:uncharacterized protein [Physcomitrium patens]|uniref:uncharacterized protein n=1 Tax=Physcomitrium patens TaxID=3218 RepID=UPI003CCE0A56